MAGRARHLGVVLGRGGARRISGDRGVVGAFTPCNSNVYIRRIGGNYIFDAGLDLGGFGQRSAVVP